MCGRRLLQLLRVRQLLRVLSPCCVAAAVAERVSYGCVDIWMCKSIALKLSARCVPPRDAAQHQPRGCCAQQLRSNYQADNQADTSVRTIRLIIRLAKVPVRGGLVLAGQGQTSNPLEFGGDRKTIGKL